MSRKFEAGQLPTAEQLQAELDRVKYRRRYRRVLGSTIFTLIGAAVVVLAVTLIFPVLRISSDSMANTLTSGDLVMTLGGVETGAGDVIAFNYGSGKVLVKRVIAEAGDVVEIREDGSVYVNEAKLDEPYVTKKALGECDIEMPYTVPEGRVFVLGDCRAESLDSRNTAVGCVAEEQIIGRVALRIWPLGKIGLIGD